MIRKQNNHWDYKFGLFHIKDRIHVVFKLCIIWVFFNNIVKQSNKAISELFFFCKFFFVWLITVCQSHLEVHLLSLFEVNSFVVLHTDHEFPFLNETRKCFIWCFTSLRKSSELKMLDFFESYGIDLNTVNYDNNYWFIKLFE